MTLQNWIDALSESRSGWDRDHAIQLLGSLLGHPQALVMPGEGTVCWRAAAWALRLMGRPRLDPALPGMFRWLRELNAPGTDIVRRTLLETLPPGNLVQEIERAAGLAQEEGDSQWLYALGRLSIEAGLTKADFFLPARFEAMQAAPPPTAATAPNAVKGTCKQKGENMCEP